jgi:glycosyltransferase involved in cell wall biosynthesis
MKVLVQVGNLRSGLINHLMRPLVQAENVREISLVCRNPGPAIPKLKYHCPPRFISRFAPAAVACEFFILLYISVFKKPSCILGFLLFPHGLMAFMAAKLARRPVGIALIAGQVELYAIGSPLGVEFTKPPPLPGKIFLKIMKRCDVIMVTNSSSQEFLLSQGMDKGKIHILPQPVARDRYYPMDIPKKYDAISVGRLAPVKHVEIFLKAISEVKKEYEGIKACIVGNGPSRAYLERLAIDLGLARCVEFAGFKEDVTRYYNSARIFVMTSEREGGPFTLMEAMACAIPAVTSRCGVVSDIGQDGSNCIIIENYNDSAAFAEAIVRLLKDEDLCHRLAQNALETASSISMEKATQAWNTILRQLTA